MFEMEQRMCQTDQCPESKKSMRIRRVAELQLGCGRIVSKITYLL